MEIYGAFSILFLFHPFSFSFCSLAPLALRSRDDLRYLRKMLCGETSTKKGMLEEALKDSEFQLILNANPSSRLRVEAGPKSKMDQHVPKCEPNTKKGWEGAKELEGTGRTLVFDIFWHLLDVLDMLGHAWPCSFFGLFSTWATLNIMKPTKPRPLAVSFPKTVLQQVSTACVKIPTASIWIETGMRNGTWAQNILPSNRMGNVPSASRLTLCWATF